MTATHFIAQGGFNTGRLYRREGQRIFWAQRADGWLYFNDIDRMISGWMHRPGPAAVIAAPVLPGWLMTRYDASLYGFQPDGGLTERAPSVPEEFDFGPMLRI